MSKNMHISSPIAVTYMEKEIGTSFNEKLT